MRDDRRSPADDEGTNQGEPERKLGLGDAVSLIVGVVIGAGIFETAPLVFSNVDGPWLGLACWAIGGALSLAGACCYAELASTYPRAGGDYVYLSRAFGPKMAFFFAWAQLSLILTASIGMMAYVFADYARAVFPFGERTSAAVAAGAVVVLTALNLASVTVGKTTQNILTVLKVAGLAAVVLAGFFAGGAHETASTQNRAPGAASGASLGLAMVLVLYTFGGWNDAAFVAAEVRDRRRHIARALILGTGLVTLVYLLVNAAFLAGLGFEGVRASRAVAADLLGTSFGPVGRTAISVLVMISALGAANAIIFMGARVHASLGRDYAGLSVLGNWHARRGQPAGALLVQAAVAVLLIALAGLGLGRSLIDRGFAALGVPGTPWTGHGGFDTLLRCTAPVFWFFFLMTGVSVFVLRVRDRHVDRPFRVPLFPLTPLVFCGTCAWMFIASLDYAGRLVLLSVPFLLLGIPFYFTRRQGRTGPVPTRVPAETIP
ncbi:MAG TPA: amino acid permease [Polyangiaceae bacterium]